MIFYFTGTGNSQWAAKKIAEQIGDRAYSITELREVPSVCKEKQVGFVFPVYAWGAPEPMILFAKKIQHAPIFSFGVGTCGGEAGMAMKKFAGFYPLDSCYSLVMPNNYIVGTDTEDKESIDRKIHMAKEEICRLSQEIKRQEKVYRVHEGTLAGLKSSVANWGFNNFARSANPFYVTGDCNGCGLCAKNCPASAITIIDKIPVWEKRCYQCMRCINACPKQAVQYGKATKSRRRYTIEKYVDQDDL